MGKQLITFGDIEVEKHKFQQHKIHPSIGDVNNNKIIVSNKVSVGKKSFKYFIDYKDDKNFKLLCVILPKLMAYRGDSGETKYMSF